MHEEEYTFVTIDSDQADWSDAVIVDLDNDDMLLDAVVIDEGFEGADFITLSDDTIMLSDADMLDMSSGLDLDSSDIIIL
ncbi:hypothetical protein [Parabacteroides sp. PF5-6]|uniref:hypothetical protein n=1 Tax=Parabacteroides sp. PF5-6 TaxID=1742403 RepID=UPI0024074BC0|nr:hypothetical protein [Parabacteroides sp. PF5-6]MDF9829613.1 hypothetical protein [Parabacteroides sp. PF5-6]